MTNNVRIEEDLLGQREVPADAYYGIHTLRAVENFYITEETINSIPEFIRGMVMVKKAAALANTELKVIPRVVGEAIVKACDEMLVKGKCMDQFPTTTLQGGAGTSVNMNTNEVIANIALEMMGHKKGEYKFVNPNDHVNKSQSTNCAFPTGMRIGLYNSIMDLMEAINVLRASLDKKAVEFKTMMKMGRTHLQDAVPMTLGQEFQAYSDILEEELGNLQFNANYLLTCNLGATAIGTGLNAVEGYRELSAKKLAEVSGHNVVSAKNLIAATSDCGDYVAVHAAVKRLAVKLIKICNDLRLLASGPRCGLKEINLPEMQAGSSIMPAKVNPVIPEVVNQACFKVVGNDTCVMMAAQAGQLQLNVMEPAIAQPSFESIKLMRNACHNLAEKCIDGITANPEICMNSVLGSIGIVTYLNEHIGHHEGDIVGKICAESGRQVREVVLERGLLSEAEVDDLLSVENLMNPTYKAKRFED